MFSTVIFHTMSPIHTILRCGLRICSATAPRSCIAYLWTGMRRNNYFRIDLTNGTVMEKRRILDIPALSEWEWSVSIMTADNHGNLYFASSGSDSIPRIFVFDPEFELIGSFGSAGTGEGQFGWISDLYFDSNNDLFVVDSKLGRIQKLESDGRFIAKYGISGPPRGDSYLYHPECIIDDGKGSLYVCDRGNDRIKILYHNITFHEVEEVTGFEDTDGDGLSDQDELNGHLINVEYQSRGIMVNVTSDPKMADTDADGLDDLLEWNLSSDPRSTDTDNDGIPDDQEYYLGTNLSNLDTDGDLLADGEELSFMSSPLLRDTDGDGLDDRDEFNHGTDPNDDDTDDDGLSDKIEVQLGYDPLNADPDGDFMFDSAEFDAGTSTDDPDKDKDGLKDGFEAIYKTDPLSGDSDGDLVPDGFEVDMMMSPINNDTDGDGLQDGKELEFGSNPLSSDSDGDGIKDSEDMDFTLTLEEPVILVYDGGKGVEGYVENLTSSIDTIIVDPKDFASYQDSRYIVLVGKPSDKGDTAGRITNSILSNTSGILENMQASDMNRFALRYGEWAENQTVLMLSKPYESDHYRTLGMLKSMKMMVSQGMVKTYYMNPRCCFSLDQVRNNQGNGFNREGQVCLKCDL